MKETEDIKEFGIIPDYFKDYKAKEDESLYTHTKLLLDNLIELNTYYKFPYFELIALACIYHDIGKINPIFQRRLAEGTKFDENVEIPHNILSLYLANKFINNINDDDKNIILYAILNHHHYTNNNDLISDKTELIQDNLRKISAKLNNSENDRDLFFNSFGIRKRKRVNDVIDNMDKKAVMIKGLLHRCDYSASAHTTMEVLNYDLINRLESWVAVGRKWNEMQTFALSNQDSNLVIIGSTGLGKTEASLLWIGNNKGFYVLPLKTAINAMYFRLQNDFYTQDYTKYLGLLHSETKDVYLGNGRVSSSVNDEESSKFWSYYESTRMLSLPLIITTPDQLFRFAFKHPAYEMQLATLSYSKIVIDEIQAYSPDILAVLIYGISQIVEMGGKFAITTATLPPFIMDLLQEAVNKELKWQQKEFLNNTNRHHLEIRDNECSAEDILDFYKTNIDKSSLKILVVLNTVKKAQQLYRHLSKLISDSQEEEVVVRLIHAKYIVKDRKEKEQHIKEDADCKDNKKVIWLATSIVEASLDIDFDYLFAEMSDLSGLFQRMGRCNRKGLKSIERPNVFVYCKIDSNLFRKKKTKNGHQSSEIIGFIYKSLYQLGLRALMEWKSAKSTLILSEEEKVRMINQYYSTANIKKFEKEDSGESYLADYKNRFDYIKGLVPGTMSLDEARKKFRNIISFKIIPVSVYTKNKDLIDKKIVEIASSRQEIRELKNNLNNIEQMKNLRMKIISDKDFINQFTLSIEPNRFINFQQPIKVDYEEIYLYEGKYDYNLGLQKEQYDFDEEAMIW